LPKTIVSVEPGVTHALSADVVGLRIRSRSRAAIAVRSWRACDKPNDAPEQHGVVTSEVEPQKACLQSGAFSDA
jgi:hypothetical protein